MDQKKPDELVIAIRTYKNHGTNRIMADVVRNTDDGIRGLHDTPLGSIVCSAYVGHDFGDHPKNEIWGFDIQAEDIGYAKADRLENIAKILRSIERKMEKMSQVEGPSQSFGAYVNRFGRAIGAKKVVINKNNGWGGTHSIREAAWCVEQVHRQHWPEEAKTV